MTKRLHRFLLYPLAASVPAAGMLIATGTAASASSTPAHAAGSTPAAQAAALAKYVISDLIGQNPTNETAGSSRSVDGLTNVQSHNWAGYADTGSGFSKVSASWNEPAATCGLSLTPSISAFWVGLDGLKSSSVEQDGTMTECYLGAEYQYTWWEMYPDNSVQTVGSTVSAGDHITASVTRSGSSYKLSVTDSTNPANSFSTTQSCSSACDNTSAEVVAEAPSSNWGVYPLTQFATWSPSGISIATGSKSGTISSFSEDKITMIGQSGDTEAVPSALYDSGRAFDVTWQSAQ
jgi:hypothetical protein